MLQLWADDEDHRAIKLAQTIDELPAIALRILHRMPEPIGMVCGPISSGYRTIQANITALRQSIDRLQRIEKNIFDQTIFEGTLFRLKRFAPVGDVFFILERFYRPVFKSRRISTCYFMPNWQTSTGACWKHKEAQKLGIEIVELQN